MKSIVLKPGRDKPLRRRHPWVFQSAIAETRGNPGSGETVEILTEDGGWLARGAYSPKSKIRCRVWAWDPKTEIPSPFFSSRLERALRFREDLFKGGQTSAYREVFAESDGIPGLIVDRYANFRVIQFLTAGVERWRETIVGLLAARGDCEGVYERSDVDVRELEGLELKSGLLWGKQPHEDVIVSEGKLSYAVDITGGQKTGFYLDQRDNRQALSDWLTPGGRVLDCFSYTGGFSVAALAAGAKEVLAIDSSASSLRGAERNVRLNGLDESRFSTRAEDAFTALRSLQDAGEVFDVIILDPPKFAPTPAHVHKASRGYKDINLFAFKLLAPGGKLFTFSCSGGVQASLFQKIVADAALDAGREVKAVHWLSQPADHPVALNFPESRYLKGLVCLV
jgi:23S rRNA (cytosine1962-C5)-methyltransferase